MVVQLKAPAMSASFRLVRISKFVLAWIYIPPMVDTGIKTFATSRNHSHKRNFCDNMNVIGHPLSDDGNFLRSR